MPPKEPLLQVKIPLGSKLAKELSEFMDHYETNIKYESGLEVQRKPLSKAQQDAMLSDLNDIFARAGINMGQDIDKLNKGKVSNIQDAMAPGILGPMILGLMSSGQTKGMEPRTRIRYANIAEDMVKRFGDKK